MNNVSFNAGDLMLALGITSDEATGILSGDLEFDDGELTRLARWKGVSVEAVEEYFAMSAF